MTSLPATLTFNIATCSLGHVLAAQTHRGVCAIFLGDQPDALIHALHTAFPHTLTVQNEADTAPTLATLIHHIEAPSVTTLDFQLDVYGTAFQKNVWQALREIPYGQQASYTAIAHRIGTPKAVRAVASACAANKLAMAIPCHRAVRQNGELAGYRWGIARKHALLAKEAANAPQQRP